MVGWYIWYNHADRRWQQRLTEAMEKKVTLSPPGLRVAEEKTFDQLVDDSGIAKKPRIRLWKDRIDKKIALGSGGNAA